MLYRFTVEVWTNSPIETEVELQKALDLHSALRGCEVEVSGRELAINGQSSEIGDNPDGDPWHLYIEGQANSPHWLRGEISQAIRNHVPTSKLGMNIQRGYTALMGQDDLVTTADEVERWLRQQERQ